MPSTLSTDLLTPHPNPNPYTPDYRPLLLLTSSSLTFILALLSARRGSRKLNKPFPFYSQNMVFADDGFSAHGTAAKAFGIASLLSLGGFGVLVGCVWSGSRARSLEEFANITRHKLREKGLALPEVEEQEVEVDFGSMWTQLWKEIREGNTKEENELMDKEEAEKASVSA
ncbi:hypothetical protein SAICODRAFT_20335 [Saitoella complicata NRRL Y-17804]|uniref:uncharacterized protein n=1 Tax=Saitoella complicata (strain BCRC 22490 / CBS 7301 / JCM 7358 / NBRC 10748 / NRRL Y-17804) TaxID=698492 RepID=UPI0008677E5D|nr:uncharacterized protein SAICODRAFT_20335 [Saitoella complicata NRRL Y-17804]ODQ51666.1 hypothetical protein SAICODRAFT_20335 [Saitoella complicata NRRL Y-17804]